MQLPAAFCAICHRRCLLTEAMARRSTGTVERAATLFISGFHWHRPCIQRTPVAARAKVIAATIEAMTCKLVASLPDGDEWLYEIKWDGYRAIGSKSGTTTALFSRRQNSFARTFPDVQAALASLRCRSAIVDGEVVAVG